MMKKKRVAIVVSHPIQHFCPQYASFYGHPLAEVRVFFASRLGSVKYVDPNFKQEVSWGNLRLDAFDHVFMNGESADMPDKHIDAPGLEGYLEAFDPDCVVVYGYFQKLQRRAIRWAQSKHVMLAYISDSESRQKRSTFNKWAKGFYLRSLFRKIDFFLTVGDANEAYYSGYGVPASKFVRMHFPIDLEFYRDCFGKREQLKQRVCQQWSIHNGAPVLSVVGKLVPWKSQDHIIRALKQLEGKGVILNLLVIGSGEMKEAWERLAREVQRSRVIFTGFVGNLDLPAYYAATDIYVHPAAIEPHSIAISEAIYMGCPVVVSSRCGSYGPTDDVQDGSNGYVFEQGNIDDLAEKLERLASDSMLRNTFAERSHMISVGFQDISHRAVLDALIGRMESKMTKQYAKGSL